MTSTAAPPETADPPPPTHTPPLLADERISHRGPMQRWLLTPEIGALVGALIVWAFFWGVSDTFGEADSTLNWLDVAAPTGIMATAVALLMIGGEFDLSSGVMTGATAIYIGLFAKHFMGAGVNIGWAIGTVFLAAGAVGWLNGYMVNKTGLPSFIITLASFFTLRGVMLVMSKRLDGKVQVADITKTRGAATYKKWIAHEWKFTEFRGRDTLFVALVAVGVLLFVYGLLEHSFTRRSPLDMVGVAGAVLGIGIALVGFFGLLHTDGVGVNVAFSAIGMVGLVIATWGLARSRWETRVTHISGPLPPAARNRFALGVAGMTLACIVPIPFSRDERREILTWTLSGLRPVIAILAGAVGLALAIRSSLPVLRARTGLRTRIGVGLFAAYSALLVGTAVICAFQLTTVQALRAVLMIVLATGGLSMMLLARRSAGHISRGWQLVIGTVAAASIAVLALVVRADASAVRFRTGMMGAVLLGATVILANAILEYAMEKRRVADHDADHFGRNLQVVGGAVAVLGLAIRLLFTNLTAAHAAEVKANGGTVGQNVLRETVVWWLLVAAIGAFVLTKTKWGNWIFAVGGNKDAARAIGVPVDQVKIALFVLVSLCGALSGTLIALRYGTVQANQGIGLEFEYIIACVVGGCLLTGGYGSVVGASLGAAIMAMSTVGVSSVVEWNSDGRYAFLGAVLLAAVLVNNFTRKKAQEAR